MNIVNHEGLEAQYKTLVVVRLNLAAYLEAKHGKI